MPDTVFPIRSPLRPREFPIENFDIKAYLEGMKAPNTVGAIAEGVTEGIQANQTARLTEANIAKTEAEVQLTPLRIQTEVLNAQTAALRAKTEAELGPQKATIDLMTAQTSAKRAEYETQTAQLDQQLKQQAIDRSIGANKVITAAQSGDITTAVVLAEDNKAALIGGIFDKDNHLSAGYQQAVESLPQAAREAVAAGRAPAEIIQRADRIYAAYQRQADVETAKERKEYAPQLPKLSSTPLAAPVSESAQQQQQSPQQLSSEPEGQRQQQLQRPTAATQEGIGAQVPGLPQQQQPAPSQPATPQAPTAYTPGPVTQAQADPPLPQLKEAPNSSVGSSEWRNKRIQNLTQQLYQEGLNAFPDPRNATSADRVALMKQAREQALKQIDSVALSPDEHKELSAIQNNALGFDRIKVRADVAVTHLDEWIAAYGDPSLGPTATWATLEQAARAKLGFPGDRGKYDQLASIKKELSDVASAVGVLANAELGGTGRTIDSNEERKGMQGMYISPDSSLLQIRSGYNLLKAKARENADVSTVVKGLLDKGENYSTAIRKAFIYQDQNKSYIFDPTKRIPAELTGTGKDEAIPIENPNRMTGQQYLTLLTTPGNIYGGSGQSGRVSGSATTPTDGYSLLSRFQTPEGKLDRTSLTSAAKNLDPRQIPHRMQQANEALVLSIVNTESGGNPNAKAKATLDNPNASASGLMQLIDETGKPLWKSMGFDKTLGEYNPFHPEANIAMGTKYINKQLDRFNGDVRLAVAAYKRGPEKIGQIYDTLTKETGSIPTWDQVKAFLPEEAKVDANKYVRKVLGDDRLDTTPKMPPGMSYADAVSTLPQGPAQQHATEALTPRAKEDFASTIAATKIEHVQGTPFGDLASEIMSILSPEEAQAETVGAEPETTAATTSGQAETTVTGNIPTASVGLRGGNLPDQYAQTDPSKNYGLEALVMGASRMATFGGDVTAASHLISWKTGEPYEQVYQRMQGLRDALYEKYPGYYIAGAATGIVAPNLASGVGRAAAPGLMSKVFGPKVAAPAVTIAQTAKIGAVAGGVQGFLEAHPTEDSSTLSAIGERSVAGAKGAVVGGTAGLVLGAGAAGIGKALKSIPIAPADKTMNKAQKEVSQRFSGVTTPELQNELAMELAGKNPNRVFGSTVPGVGNIEQLVKAQATVPEVSEGLQRKATKYFDERNTSAREFLKENIPEFATTEAVGVSPSAELTASLESKLASRNDRVGSSLGLQATGKQLPAAAEDAHRSLAKLAVAKETQLEAERKAATAPLYAQAEKELGNLRREPRVNVAFQVGPYTGDNRQLLNKGKDQIYAEEGQLYRQLTTTKGPPVPGIANPDFIQMVKDDPVLSQAIGQAQTQVGGGTLPANSLEVLTQAKRNLASEASQPNGYAAGNAFAKLREAMGDPAFGGSSTLKEADKLYYEGSEKIRGFATPLVQKIQKFAKIGQEADVTQLPNRILAMSKDTLTQFLGHFSSEEKQVIKDSVVSHLHSQFVDQGEKTVGKLQTLPDLSKPQLAGRLKVLFGEKETEKVLSDLSTEQKMHQLFGELHGTSDAGEYLLKQSPAKLKNILANLSGKELTDAKAAVGEHVMNVLERQKEIAPGQALFFPDFLSNEGREKLQIVLGKDTGDALADRFKEEVQTSALMRSVRQHGSSTAPTLTEQQRQKATMVARGMHAVLKPFFYGMRGIPSAQLDVAAILRSLPEGRKVAKEITDIVVNNPEMRIDFLKKEIAKRLKEEKQAELIKPIHEAIDFIVDSYRSTEAGRAAGQGAESKRSKDDKLYNLGYLKSRDAARQLIGD